MKSKRAKLARRARVYQDYEKIAHALEATVNPHLCAALVTSLKVGSGDTVLDLGGGTCGYAAYLSRELNVRAICLDQSIEMLYAADVGEVPRICGDALQLPLRTRTIKAAYMVNLLQLIPDARCLFRGVRRVMKPKGRLVLPITTRAQLQTRFLNKFFPGLLEVERRRYFSRTELTAMLRDVGFKVISVSPLDLGCFQVDESYIHRLRSGILSGLLLLDSGEREAGFSRLERLVRQTASEGHCTVVRRIRTLVIAEAQ